MTIEYVNQIYKNVFPTKKGMNNINISYKCLHIDFPIKESWIKRDSRTKQNTSSRYPTNIVVKRPTTKIYCPASKPQIDGNTQLWKLFYFIFLAFFKFMCVVFCIILSTYIGIHFQCVKHLIKHLYRNDRHISFKRCLN